GPEAAREKGLFRREDVFTSLKWRNRSQSVRATGSVSARSMAISRGEGLHPIYIEPQSNPFLPILAV
ncbi:MAG: hypothetical protein RB191_22070, partial [Terriglobia bacterium]|nr:hypothetical protein [Terriglobia bacterium]